MSTARSGDRSETFDGEPLERGHETEVVERARSKLDRQPADVLERGGDELPDRRRRLARLVGGGDVVEVPEPEQDRRQRLARLVVQLAGQPRAFELLGFDDAAQRVATHALRQVDRDRGACDERLGEADVGLVEPRILRRACRAPRRRRSACPRTVSGR